MPTPRQVLIVGGGTAGWLTANWLQHSWRDRGATISLIESAAIGTIGVGEGTTPSIREMFRKLDIPETEWMPACHATYKCGISFPGWSTVPGFESYFHPFYSHFDTEFALRFFDNCNYRRKGHDVPVHPDDYFLTSMLVRQFRSPIPKTPLPYDHDYGYHFDAGLLGNFLRRKASDRGVLRIEDTVTEVILDADGDIRGVRTESHGVVEADFFIDCSGLRGLLLQQALDEPLVRYRKYLKNDRAVALPTPATRSDRVPSETVSKALKYGWVWHIPLMNRMGNGYVYSSAYVSAADAEREFRDYLGLAEDEVHAVHLRWEPGRVENHWKRNCVAIGLAQGFLEPLEAAMLNVIQFTVENVVREFERGPIDKDRTSRFNSRINWLIDGIRDYLQLHYKLNSRTDTDYWRDNRENTSFSRSLGEIMTAWNGPGSFDEVMQREQLHQVYKRTSWYCMLSGMGMYVRSTKPPKGSSRTYVERLHAASNRRARRFHRHGDYLSSLHDSHARKPAAVPL